MKVLQSIKNSLKYIKWYEWAYSATFLVATIVLATVFHSPALVIVNSIVGIFSISIVSKGFFLGAFTNCVSAIIYAALSYVNKYYGEALVGLCITLPMSLARIFLWYKNRQKGNGGFISIAQKAKWQELVIVACVALCSSVGFYFMLKAFNTSNLIFSTISMTLGCVAGYLQLRRYTFNFAIYITNNIICICLWVPVMLGDIANLPTVVSYVMYTGLNFFGIVNWVSLKKKQQTLQTEVATEIATENQSNDKEN